MKNNNLIIAGVVVIGVIAIAAIGGFMILGQNNNETSDEMAMESEEVMEDTQSDESMMEEEQMAMAESGNYVEFAQNSFEEVSSDGQVLYFYANWCPTCRAADPEFQESSANLPVKVVRVNYNDSDTDEAEEALADKYNITYQHTFVQLDENGREVTRWNGGSVEELNENIK